MQEGLSTYMKKCHNMTRAIGNTYLYSLLFADDQILISNEEGDFTYMTKKLSDEYRERGMIANISKPEYVVMGEKPNVIRKSTKEFRNLETYLKVQVYCKKQNHK